MATKMEAKDAKAFSQKTNKLLNRNSMVVDYIQKIITLSNKILGKTETTPYLRLIAMAKRKESSGGDGQPLYAAIVKGPTDIYAKFRTRILEEDLGWLSEQNIKLTITAKNGGKKEEGIIKLSVLYNTLIAPENEETMVEDTLDFESYMFNIFLHVCDLDDDRVKLLKTTAEYNKGVEGASEGLKAIVKNTRKKVRDAGIDDSSASVNNIMPLMNDMLNNGAMKTELDSIVQNIQSGKGLDIGGIFNTLQQAVQATEEEDLTDDEEDE